MHGADSPGRLCDRNNNWTVITLKCMSAQKRIHWLSPSLPSVSEKRKISVVMPARNETQDIAASVQSILNQKNVNLEVVVVNDHPATVQAKLLMISRSDSRLKVLHNPSLMKRWLGKYNAMQCGTAETSGDYLYYTSAGFKRQRINSLTRAGDKSKRMTQDGQK